MDINLYGVSTQGIYNRVQIDHYDRYLADLDEGRYTPTPKEGAELFMTNQLVEGGNMGLGYKWIFQYRSLQQSRLQTLQQKLQTALQASLDRAFAAGGAARGGAIPMLRNYWNLWQVDALPSNNGTSQAYYGSFNDVVPGSVGGGGNIRALPERTVTFEVSSGLPQTDRPIGTPMYSLGTLSRDRYYTNSTPPAAPPAAPGTPAIGENVFLKTLFEAFQSLDMQEMFSQSSSRTGQALFREVFVGAAASDAFGSSLTAAITINFEARATRSDGTPVTRLTMNLNKATAFYHS